MRSVDPRDDTVLHAELVLCLRGASLADVYRASAAFSVPRLGRLCGALGETGHGRFGEVIAAEHTRSSAAAALLHREMIFHDIILELGGNETLAALQAVLHRLVDDALHRLAPLASPATVVDVVDGRTHREVVRLVEAGRGRDAQLLAHRRTLQVEALLRADGLTGAPLRDLLL
jgi:DNA-binding FadR family transcriptional regulator